MCKEYMYPAFWKGAHEACMFTVLDVETTGLNSKVAEVIEIGLVQVKVDDDVGFKVINQVNYLREPNTMPLPEKIKELTGITDAEITGRVICERKVEEMRRLLKESDFVVAHNAAFDRPFVEGLLGTQDVPWVCSVMDVPWRDIGYRHSSLEYLSLKNGWRFEGHRAWQDAHMTAFTITTWQEKGIHPCGLGYLLARFKEGRVYTVKAYRAPFAVKDVLKSRGYHWDAQNKVWWSGVADKVSGEKEVAWVQENAGGAPRLESVELTRRFR